MMHQTDDLNILTWIKLFHQNEGHHEEKHCWTHTLRRSRIDLFFDKMEGVRQGYGDEISHVLVQNS